MGTNTVAYSMVVTGGFLYVYVTVGFGFDVSILKYDLSTFTLAATLAIAGDIYPSYPNAGLLQLSSDGTKLYALTRRAGYAMLNEISLASFTVTRSTNISALVTLPQWEAFSILAT